LRDSINFEKVAITDMSNSKQVLLGALEFHGHVAGRQWLVYV